MKNKSASCGKLSVADFDSYIIVIKDDPISEYYYNYVIPEWHKYDIYPQRVDAITPATLPDGPLKFGNDTTRKQFVKHVEYSATEIACWYSHYLLWKQISQNDRPAMIIEHDGWPTERVGIHPLYHLYCYAAGTGCYTITPALASRLAHDAERALISTGPLGFISRLTRDRHSRVSVISRLDIEPSVLHAYNPTLGTTITHGGKPLEAPENEWPIYKIVQ